MPMNGPSAHLSWSELACHDGTEYPMVWRRNRAIILAEVFELIRSQCGNKPITVLSAYRTVEHNRKVNGAPASQHLQGRALDLRAPSGYSINEFYNIVRQLTSGTAIKGLGLYPTFIHVDTRPSTRLVTW